jgi:methylmalonyl-CoA carboxyltransferase large subunit
MAAGQIDVEALAKRLEQLEARVRELEAGAVNSASPRAPTLAPASASAPAAAAAASAPAEELSEDVLTAISAAIAAFLGVKARIKQVRLVGREVWAQQGRASIMASHRVAGRG